MNKDLTATQNDYAIFLPAISGFYATFIGKQRREEYVEYNRVPKHFTNGVESINWLTRDQSLFQYQWSLYSAGHAELDVNKDGINISTKVKGLNFTGNAVSSVNIGQEQTNVVVEMSTNIDGGEPDSEFGSISRLDGGAI